MEATKTICCMKGEEILIMLQEPKLDLKAAEAACRIYEEGENEVVSDHTAQSWLF